MNKKILLLSALVLVLFTGCKKSNTNDCTPSNPDKTVPDAEMTALVAYLDSKGLTAAVTLHPRKFYYKINTAGTGGAPTTCSSVFVKYRGALTNDTVFTSPTELTDGAIFNLGQLIAGWQLGLQLVQRGGAITLFLPPSLAYGSTATGSVPANSILIFDISLVDFSN